MYLLTSSKSSRGAISFLSGWVGVMWRVTREWQDMLTPGTAPDVRLVIMDECGCRVCVCVIYLFQSSFVCPCPCSLFMCVVSRSDLCGGLLN